MADDNAAAERGLFCRPPRPVVQAKAGSTQEMVGSSRGDRLIAPEPRSIRRGSRLRAPRAVDELCEPFMSSASRLRAQRAADELREPSARTKDEPYSPWKLC